ncbi:MAG: glycosyltransferase [Xanthobacteraceae bacterium]|nr:glycosyltransferase [Xanthobacteraceae bacterium]
MRILHTEASTGWGGQEIRILDESSGLRARGYEVRIAAPVEAQIVAAAKRRGIPVHPVPINRRGPRAIWALLQLFKELRPDVVVTHSSTDTWLVALSARISSVRPAVIRMRHLSTPVAHGPLNRWLYGAALQRLVTTGAAIRLTLIEKLRLDPDSVISIPTGTDMSRFAPGDRAHARAQLGLPALSPIIGIVATLRSWKGHRFLISALKDPRLAAVMLVIVGDGPQDGALQEQVTAAGLTDRVVFAGRQNDVAPWLHALDVFALPSTGHETTPQAIQQAMACGIPVVTTPAGAGLELVLDGETGLVVTSENVAAIADAIVRILNDRELARRLAEAGRNHVMTRFTATAMLDAMEAVLRKATADSR